MYDSHCIGLCCSAEGSGDGRSQDLGISALTEAAFSCPNFIQSAILRKSFTMARDKKLWLLVDLSGLSVTAYTLGNRLLNEGFFFYFL